MKPALHTGVIIDSKTPEKWVVELIERMQECSCIRTTVGIRPVSPSPSDPEKAGLFARLTSYILHEYIDRPLFSYDPMAATPLPEIIHTCVLSENLDLFEQCDVIILLSEHPLDTSHGKLIDVGVWHAGLQSLTQHIKHTLLTQSPFIWVELYRALSSEEERASSEKLLPVSRHALPCQTFSLSDLNRLTYSSLPSFFLSRLIWLASDRDRDEAGYSKLSDNSSVFPKEQLLAVTKNFQPAMYQVSSLTNLSQVMRLLWRQTLQRLSSRFYQEQWQLAVSRQTIPEDGSIKEHASIPVADYQATGEPTDIVWADPHMCEHNGYAYVFFEQKKSHVENGRIMFAKLNESGSVIESGTALTADYHLSYPFVFSYENHYYMIPETASLELVTLYRATNFPDQWELVSHLIKGVDAADSTLHQHNGKWWLFTNCRSHRCVDERDELHLYAADDLKGPWTPHPLNPVITGVDRARMAGAILNKAGQLYRVSQYGAFRYGYGVNISRIDELSMHNYRETACEQILPSDRGQWRACHSFGQLNGLQIIDRMRLSRR